MRKTMTLLAAASLAVLLAGCSPIWAGSADRHPAGGDQGVTDGGAPKGGHVHCADDQSIVLNGQAVMYDVTGDCGGVDVKGQSIVASIDSASSVTIEGQADKVTVGSDIGGLTINGDANSLTAGDITAIAVSGQGNKVDGKTLGTLSINGGDNTVTGDTAPSPSNVNGQGNQVLQR